MRVSGSDDSARRRRWGFSEQYFQRASAHLDEDVLVHLDRGRMGVVSQRSLTRLDQMRCFLLMRMFGGSLNVDAAERQFGGRFRQTLRAELTGLRLLGAITQHYGNLYLTESGYYLWVMMMREFFSGINNIRERMRYDFSQEVRAPQSGIVKPGH